MHALAAAARRAAAGCILAAVACTALAGSPAAQSPAASPAGKNVLLLLPGDTGQPWTAPLAAALRATLEQSDETVFMYSEQLDADPFRGTGYPERLRDWLSDKYRDTPIHLIVAAGPQPEAFLVQHAPLQWQSVPVVALHDPQFGPVPPLHGGVTGFSSGYDVLGTVQDAIEVMPDTRRVALVSGASAEERHRAATHAREVAALAGVEAVDLGGLPFAELLERVRALPADAIVVFLGLSVDGEGRAFLPGRALSAISAASSRPVFGTYETLVGRGLLGGRGFSFEAAGQALGRLGLRVLAGEPVGSIAVETRSFSRAMYDAHELARFGIDARVLPVEAEVRNRIAHPVRGVSLGTAGDRRRVHAFRRP